jgi:hypothetical protein
MDAGLKFAVKTLDTLEKKGKLPGNYDDELQDLNDSELRNALFNKMFDRFFNND